MAALGRKRRRPGQKVYIYHLVDPVTGEIRYVGQSVNPKNRAASHPSSPIPEVREWIQSLTDQGLKVKLAIVSTCKPGCEYAEEKAETLRVLATGARLLNREWVQPIVGRARTKFIACTFTFGATNTIKDALAALAKKKSMQSMSQAARFAIIKYLTSEGYLNEGVEQPLK